MTAGRGADSHRAALAGLGLPAERVDSLAAYLGLLAAWNRRINLSGAHTPGERVEVLVAPVVPLATLVEPPTLLDVGSGNGSPGLVLALLRPDLCVTLLEPRLKRWAFLREVARRLERGDIAVERLRHDQYTGPPARTVTVRALALPLDALAPLVAPGGRLIVLGRRPEANGAVFEAEAGASRVADGAVFRRCAT